MNAQAPLVFDAMMGTNPKAVWAEGGRWFCRCGTGKIEVAPMGGVAGVYRTLPGTFESAPKPKRMADWRRRALARMQS